MDKTLGRHIVALASISGTLDEKKLSCKSRCADQVGEGEEIRGQCPAESRELGSLPDESSGSSHFISHVGEPLH